MSFCYTFSIKIIPVKTARIEVNNNLFYHLETSLPKQLPEKTIVVISSKIIALCEGWVVPVKGTDKDKLIKRESDAYLERSFVPHEYAIHTMKDNMIMPTAGIDASNTGDHYALLPRDSYQSASNIYQWLCDTYHVRDVGVIVADSRSTLLRRGVVGHALAYYGFNPIYNYRGTVDLYGRVMHVSQSNIPDSLAAAAVLAMGEGDESTPIALVHEVSRIEFDMNYGREHFELPAEHDIYMPFYNLAPWKKPKK